MSGAVEVTRIGAPSAPIQSEPGISERRHPRNWYLFLGSIVFASLFPMIAIPTTQYLLPKAAASYYLLYVLAAIGSNFHVGATGWFFFDPAMRSHFLSYPFRYLVIPFVLIVGTALLFSYSGNETTTYFFEFFACWLLWHYQKQNVGILSFVTAATGGASLSAWERRTLMLGAAAGITATLRHWGAGLSLLSTTGVQSSFGIELSPIFVEAVERYNVSAVLLGLLLLAIVATIIKTPALRENKLRLGFFLFGALFFLPAFIFSGPIATFAPFAIAHGWQYVVFMTFVSLNQNKGPILSEFVLLLVSGIGFLLLDSHPRIREWLGVLDSRVFEGMVYGIVMSHFVLDARIWRLREPFQRQYMRDKFSFIFAR